jgi:hypothetical protein
MSSRVPLFTLLLVLFLAPAGRSNLINRYSFNNGDTTAIDSIGGKNGTLEGNATISNNAVQLDGDSYVNLPGGLITGLTSLTFEAWFTCSSSSGTWTRIWDFGDTNPSTGYGRYYIFFTPLSGASTFRYAISNADPGFNSENSADTTPTTTGVPVYVACVHDGYSIKIYVNGVLKTSSTFTISLSSVNNVLSYVGRSLYNSDPYLIGSIDEFRIYNSALTSLEIQNSYALGTDPYAVTNPNPANTSTGVSQTAELSWTPPSGSAPDSYTAYISNNPNLTGAQIIEVPDENSCTSVLGSDTTYYWRVDTHYGTNTYTGTVWTFTTCSLPYDKSVVGDINNNFKVDVLDLKLLVEDWLTYESSPANLKEPDGPGGVKVDFADYAVLANNWLARVSPIVINEIMADNGSSLSDPSGGYDDWIEIYNCSDATVNLSGMYLTDNLDEPTKWQIPQGVTIAPQGYLLFWADEEEAQGNTHTNFKLSAGGEEVGLFDSDGTLLDSVVFDQQYSNISYGRYPDSGPDWRFFDAPSAGKCNCQGYLGVVSDPKFSIDGGFYQNGFDVSISCETPDAVIRYTTDFTNPTETSPIYTSSMHFSSTTCLRTAAFKTGWMQSQVISHTYIDLDNVAAQSTAPAGFPTTWGSNVVDYEVDPDVVNDAAYSSTFKEDLKTIPSICIVIPNDDFFGASSGIYANAAQRSWERKASIEFIDPVDGKYVQANAGLRTHGGYSRDPGVAASVAKHALQILFKNKYGLSKLEYPIFKDGDVETFDHLILRAIWNFSWTGDSGGLTERAEYNRDQFARDTVRDMGGPYEYGRHVHVYINGLYWGLYNLVERPDDGYASTRFGGSKSDYDVIKTNAQYWTGPDVIEVASGDRIAWDEMFTIAKSGLSSSANYAAIQEYLDIPGLIDYMLMIFYTGSRDAPVLIGNDMAPRNFYAVRLRQPGAQFIFLPWDVEWSLEETGVDRVNVANYINGDNNPAYLFELLKTNAEFRMLVADHVHKFFFNNGMLTPQQAGDRYHNRIMDIDRAIIGESARWGDTLRAQPYTRNVEWIAEINRLMNVYFPARTNIVLSQLRTAGLYPTVDAPVFNINGSPKYGGDVNSGDLLTMTATAGTTYYTLDGTDPRLTGEATNPNAHIFSSGSSLPITLIAESASKKVLVPTSNIGTTWKGGSEPYADSGWTHGTPIIPGKTGGVGYDNDTTYLPYISYDVKSLMYGDGKMTSCYIRIPFSISSQDLAKLTSLSLSVRCDDGYVAYINGQEVANINKPTTLLWNSTCANRLDSVDFAVTDITSYISTLHAGTNIIAIQAMNQSTTSSDLLCSLKLTGTISSNSLITLNKSTRVKARVLSSGVWSALSDATFAVGPVAENLRITEIMYHPLESPSVDPNAEFIELKNIGSEMINLGWAQFTKGITFTFPDVNLASGQYIVVVKDVNVFTAEYGSGINIAGQYSGNLDNAGEKILLEDATGQTIHNFNYSDSWFSITDGGGFSLTIRDANNTDPNSWDSKSGWRTSAYIGGSPGWDDSNAMPDRGTIVINEVLAHSHDSASDWIELYNTTNQTINIGSWFLSDSDSNLTKYEIAEGTTIGPYGYYVCYQNTNFGNTSDPGCHEAFALSENGEAVYLYAGSGGQLMGEMDTEEFDASETGVAFGRYLKSTGTYNFVAMSSNTPWQANAYPKVGPIVISEIMYHPSANSNAEYVELLNISSSPVTLQEYDNELSIYVPWRFNDSGGITFDFPLGTTMATGERLLLVKNLSIFNSVYTGVPSGVKIFEWTDGSLDNAGEKIELTKPGDQVGGIRYYIQADRINYSDGSHPAGEDPWPTAADGSGKSLGKILPQNYGNDPNNWQAITPSPGQ